MHTHGVLARCGTGCTKSAQLFLQSILHAIWQMGPIFSYVDCILSYIYIYTVHDRTVFFHTITLYIYIIYPSISAWASPLRSPKSLKSSNTLAPLPELCSPCLSSHWRISVWVWQGNPLTFGARKCWDSPADTGLGDWGTGLWLRESCKKMWRTPSCRGL